MSKNVKMTNPMKVITGPNTRWSYANVWEPKSINGGTPKYSVSLIIPKSDTMTVAKIKAAIEAAYREGEAKLKGNGKSVPALSVLKTPLRDGDLERPDDPAYAGSYFVNANATSAPGIVDADRNPILTRSEVYSGVYGRASISFYAFNSSGNKGIACGLTKANGQLTRNRLFHAPDKWAMFKKYNIRDVETEMGIQQRLAKFPVPAQVWEEYHLDQEINDRGVRLDMDLVAAAIEMDTRSRKELTDTMKEITELENPNSVQQMKAWLSANGLETDTLSKKAITDLLKTAPPKLAQVLTLRQQLAKSSVRKYQAMEKTVCADGRARGMFQFYGANRTGRFSGRNIQLQNLPQNHLSDLAEARSLVRSGDFEAVKLLYEDVPDTLSQLIRTAFIPREGTQFLVADFSAIEARVIAWFAGEKWRQDVFAKGGDIYCASASQMFKVPVEKHGINGHLRQKGKIAELALGYGGSVGALKAMGALDMGLTEDELPPLVDAWRQSNPNIVKFWWDVDRAVMEAVKFKHTTSQYGLTFSCRSGMLFITLPSGRKLAYVKPKIGTNKFGGQCITYEGIGSTKKWERLDSYGPKFVENIVQATARDILCYAMQTLRYCSIVMHIHDEVVIEADSSMSLDAVCKQMGRTPPWAKGLLLRADGYATPFYKKD